MEMDYLIQFEERKTLWMNTALFLIFLASNITALAYVGCKTWSKRYSGASLLLKLITFADLLFGSCIYAFIIIFHFISIPGYDQKESLVCTADLSVDSFFKVAAVLLGVSLARQLHVVTIFGSKESKTSIFKLIAPFLFVILLIIIPDMFSYIPNGALEDTNMARPIIFCLSSRTMPPLYLSMGVAAVLLVICATLYGALAWLCQKSQSHRGVFFTITSTQMITDTATLLTQDKEPVDSCELGGGGGVQEHSYVSDRRMPSVKTLFFVVLNGVILISPLVIAMTYREPFQRTESYSNPLYKWTIVSFFNMLAIFYYERILKTEKTVSRHSVVEVLEENSSEKKIPL